MSRMPRVELLRDVSSSISPAAKQVCMDEAPWTTSEAQRIVRATGAFGVLAVALQPEAPPSDRTIHEAFESVRDRLGHAGRQLASPTAQQAETLRHARFRVNDAWFKLRHRGSRLRLWMAWRADRAPTTQTLECPIDVVVLRAFLATDAADTVEPNSKRTYGQLVQELLGKTRVGYDGLDASTGVGTLTIEYHHSKMGARLVAAGFVPKSREYAKGMDPFKWPKWMRAAAWENIAFSLGHMGGRRDWGLRIICISWGSE